jgi:hypothetical protein
MNSSVFFLKKGNKEGDFNGKWAFMGKTAHERELFKNRR